MTKKIKAHKGGRTLVSNVRRSPAIQELLKKLATAGFSQADLLEEAAIRKAKELGIETGIETE